MSYIRLTQVYSEIKVKGHHEFLLNPSSLFPSHPCKNVMKSFLLINHTGILHFRPNSNILLLSYPPSLFPFPFPSILYWPFSNKGFIIQLIVVFLCLFYWWKPREVVGVQCATSSLFSGPEDFRSNFGKFSEFKSRFFGLASGFFFFILSGLGVNSGKRFDVSRNLGSVQAKNRWL